VPSGKYNLFDNWIVNSYSDIEKRDMETLTRLLAYRLRNIKGNTQKEKRGIHGHGQTLLWINRLSYCQWPLLCQRYVSIRKEKYQTNKNRRVPHLAWYKAVCLLICSNNDD
jgi:hypothetical protein